MPDLMVSYDERDPTVNVINNEEILSHFYQHGWVVMPAFLPCVLNQLLLDEACFDADLTPAGVGRANDFMVNRQIRRDKTHWFDAKSNAQQDYLQIMRQLQLQLNRQYFLGLFDFECHFSRYQHGDFYQKHFDAFSGRSNRVLTTVSYLNNIAVGGELVLYGPDDAILTRITPQAGTLVLFESERFAHEVLPAIDERYSIAGWFRHNNSINGFIDPSR
ncbi:2OG-Fe(II) oxygenase [Arsukibacterium sp. UBA3155]|uniref:2OG-Fe(II) oxygenase n=1 Tax=Arsukibacterium sp. UBA3155 TaxID=1946058 RepID=UPI0025BF3AA6|nr:2OG-Fe(II) oxygenase [Arsukibacterium sp. UBA3155]|tara:strand:+ start:27742 stop:28395 length:654 start_codon:yes stop_codon:yes gene_type:complete